MFIDNCISAGVQMQVYASMHLQPHICSCIDDTDGNLQVRITYIIDAGVQRYFLECTYVSAVLVFHS